MNQHISINMEDLTKTLEPLIRRVIREELSRIVKKEPNTFYLNPDMPLYEDMEDIRQRKEKDQIELNSHKEVWGE
jgi:hypothetical protein